MSDKKSEKKARTPVEIKIKTVDALPTITRGSGVIDEVLKQLKSAGKGIHLIRQFDNHSSASGFSAALKRHDLTACVRAKGVYVTVK